MDGKIIGFIVWAIVGCFIIGIGISAFFRKKAVGFWANIKAEPINDIKNYNYAMGRSEERRVGKECRSRWSPYH